jgi:hypothetical protein
VTLNDKRRPREGAVHDLGEEVGSDSTGGGGQADGAGGPFGICDPGVAMVRGLSKDAIRCYIILARFADGRTRVAHPSQVQLAGQLDWAYSEKPDRRRVQRALNDLEGAGFVRPCGRHVFDRGRWVNRYLVAPYRDAVTATASTTQPDAVTTTASGHGDPSGDAVVSGDTMRSFSSDDAVTTPAPSDQFYSNQISSEQEAVAKEQHEDQEPEPEPAPVSSLALFNHPRPRGGRRTA